MGGGVTRTNGVFLVPNFYVPLPPSQKLISHEQKHAYFGQSMRCVITQAHAQYVYTAQHTLTCARVSTLQAIVENTYIIWVDNHHIYQCRL